MAKNSNAIFAAYEVTRPGRTPKQALDLALRHALDADEYEEVTSFLRGEWDELLNIDPGMAPALEAKLIELGESTYSQQAGR